MGPYAEFIVRDLNLPINSCNLVKLGRKSPGRVQLHPSIRYGATKTASGAEDREDASNVLSC